MKMRLMNFCLGLFAVMGLQSMDIRRQGPKITINYDKSNTNDLIVGFTTKANPRQVVQIGVYQPGQLIPVIDVSFYESKYGPISDFWVGAKGIATWHSATQEGQAFPKRYIKGARDVLAEMKEENKDRVVTIKPKEIKWVPRFFGRVLPFDVDRSFTQESVKVAIPEVLQKSVQSEAGQPFFENAKGYEKLIENFLEKYFTISREKPEDNPYVYELLKNYEDYARRGFLNQPIQSLLINIGSLASDDESIRTRYQARAFIRRIQYGAIAEGAGLSGGEVVQGANLQFSSENLIKGHRVFDWKSSYVPTSEEEKKTLLYNAEGKTYYPTIALYDKTQDKKLLDLLTGQYKIHLMPKDKDMPYIITTFINELKKNEKLRKAVNAFKIKIDLGGQEMIAFYELRGKVNARVVIYAADGKENAQYILDTMYRLFKDLKGLDVTPRYNKKITSLIYYAQGDGDYKEGGAWYSDDLKKYYENDMTVYKKGIDGSEQSYYLEDPSKK